LKQGSLFEKRARGPFAAVANIDGGARGNPGPAAYGVIIRGPNGEVLAQLGEYLGMQTNNVAEYSGLLAALDWAAQQGLTSLKVLSDSELLVRQMTGQYRVKHPELKVLFQRALAKVRKLEQFAIEHVRREANREADRMVNQVLDRHGLRGG
jgi:probable phosphoglycerate mutase